MVDHFFLKAALRGKIVCFLGDVATKHLLVFILSSFLPDISAHLGRLLLVHIFSVYNNIAGLGKGGAPPLSIY